MRLLVEVADLAIVLGQGNTDRALLPMISAFIAVGVLVIVLGYRHCYHAEGETSAATMSAVPAREAN
ncbi:MAG: hypothetical protein OHK0022_43080 [Roseiflexaceae bacterium]